MEKGYYKSNIGNISVIIENQKIINIFFVDQIQKNLTPLSPLMESTLQQIKEYFQGKRREFTFPVRMKGAIFR